VIKFDLLQVGGFLQFPPPIHLTTYANLDIVISKHVKFGGIQIVLTNFCQDENNMYPPSNHYIIVLGLWCLMPLLTIFQLYRGGQMYWW
jgi:hypothetical protein